MKVIAGNCRGLYLTVQALSFWKLDLIGLVIKHSQKFFIKSVGFFEFSAIICVLSNVREGLTALLKTC